MKPARHRMQVARFACWLIFLSGSVLFATGASADTRYNVFLENDDGSLMGIGELVLHGLGRDESYTLTLDDSVFSDHFLSMRPFKCLTHAKRMMCYSPYPYENRHHITRDDLVDLEYDLMFIARTPKEYGIDPWNGRYFKLQWRGEHIRGDMYETDLNILAAPPEDGSRRPLVYEDLTPSELGGSKWAPGLLIELQ